MMRVVGLLKINRDILSPCSRTSFTLKGRRELLVHGWAVARNEDTKTCWGRKRRVASRDTDADCAQPENSH